LRTLDTETPSASAMARCVQPEAARRLLVQTRCSAEVSKTSERTGSCAAWSAVLQAPK